MKESRKLTIDGMSCQNCVRHVRRALDGIQGVEVRDVSIGSAVLEFDPAKVSDEEIVKAVADAGYPATSSAAA